MTGKQFKSIRLHLKLNQAELAAKLGVTSQAVNRWEHDVAPVSKPIEKLLLTFLNRRDLEKLVAIGL